MGRVLVCFLHGFILLVGLGFCNQIADGEEAKTGELKIEAQHIKHLRLERHSKRGPVQIEFDSPGSSVSLPIGKYRWREVVLDGGQSCDAFSAYKWYFDNSVDFNISISEDKPATLKIGGPLKQVVSVRRCGAMLFLSYSLVDTEGQTYTSNSRQHPPTFAVYKNGKTIDTGKFEYG